MTSYKEHAEKELIPAFELALAERNLQKPSDYVIETSPNGNTWLFAVLAHNRNAVNGMGKLENYTKPDTLHQLSTYLGGKHVAISNSSGFRYGILLSEKPVLPKNIPFPGFNPDKILLGRSLSGEISLLWSRFGHWAIGGMTDFGKSNLISLIALQALQTNAQIAVMDIQGRTLPQLKYSSRKLFYASDEDTCMEAIDFLWGEYLKRQKMFEKEEPAFFASDLLHYNKHTGKNLPLLIVFIEEFVELRQGIADESIRRLESLSRLSRKYGIHLVLAGQDWSKEETGAIKAQCHVKISVKMADHYQSRMLLGFSGAEKLECPGRALSNKFGANPFQSYYVDEKEVEKALLAQKTIPEQEFIEHISQNEFPREEELLIPPPTGIPSIDTTSDTAKNEEMGATIPLDTTPKPPLVSQYTAEDKVKQMLKWGVSRNAIIAALEGELTGSKQERLAFINNLDND